MISLATDVPLGQLQLMAILDRDLPKIKHQLYDANAHRVDNFMNGEMVGLKQVLEDDYDVIGIGGLITSYNYVKLACKTIKEMCPETKIVCGGGILSAIPNDMMTLIPEIDVGVIGESYITFPELLQNIDNYCNVKGIIYRKNNSFITTPSRPLIPDLDWLPFPKYDYAPLNIYFRNSSILMSKESMQSKRRLDACFSLGCSFTCLPESVEVSTTGNNKMLIGDFYYNPTKDVKAFDQNNNIVIQTPVLATQKLQGYDFTRIETSDGHSLDLTNDHKVFTKRGWVEAGKLIEGDEVLVE